jgi:hypothetical protein
MTDLTPPLSLAQIEAIEAAAQPTDEFTIYAEGPFYSSVCTSLTDEEATARRNLAPSGTDLGWRIVDGPFRDGTPNGSPCQQRPDTHRHLLYEC